MVDQTLRNLGIDIGANNTLVAHIKNGRPDVIEIDNAAMVPSIIYLEKQGGNPVVGHLALDMWADSDYDPSHSFRSWKPFMGDAAVLSTLQPGGDAGNPLAITPEYLTTLLVEYVLTAVSQDLGGESFDSILVTVPHGWRRQHPHRCRATRQAAAEANVGGRQVQIQGQTVSEPVAAAAYWIWEYNQQRGKQDGTTASDQLTPDLIGKEIMVCDVGGSTTDLSLIRIGQPDRPLDVVSAANNNFAGNFTDALLCAHVCSCFNKEYGSAYPETAEGVLEEIASPTPIYPWLRRWVLEAQDLKHDICTKIERLRPPTTIKPVRKGFTSGDGQHLQIEMTPGLFYTCLDRFYQEGQTLVAKFLRSGRRQAPYAVVFCGGGSRIAGVRERILLQILTQLYDADVATQICDRIPVNQSKVDKAIALGAALIANGIVSVQERLLHDIGIRTKVNPKIAATLNLPADNPVFVLAPVLKEHTPLPASVTNTEMEFYASAPRNGEHFNIGVVIYDDPQSPWMQHWEIPHPGKKRALDWRIRVDTEGELHIEVKTATGNTWKYSSALLRDAKNEVDSIYIGPDIPEETGQLRRITPEELQQAIQRTNRKDDISQ